MTYVYYVHVPFCASKCSYCDFASRTPRQGEMEAYVDAVLYELEARRGGFDGPLLAGYVGGGTPSMLPGGELSRLIRRLEGELGRPASGEITVEVNPDSADEELFDELLDAGVTRVSIGVQSLDDGVLGFLGRRHDSRAALRAIEAAGSRGFRTVSADLIFGAPIQKTDGVIRDARKCLDAGVSHLSAYALTLSTDTPLGRMAVIGEIRIPSSDETAATVDELAAILSERGMRRYEVSNWAMRDRECVHHRHVWAHGEIMGLGAAAVSFSDGVRLVNVADPAGYMDRAAARRSTIGTREETTGREEIRERIFLGMRNDQGVDLAALRGLGCDLQSDRKEIIELMERNGLILVKDNSLVPTHRGMSLADEIATRLWPDEWRKGPDIVNTPESC